MAGAVRTKLALSPRGGSVQTWVDAGKLHAAAVAPPSDSIHPMGMPVADQTDFGARTRQYPAADSVAEPAIQSNFEAEITESPPERQEDAPADPNTVLTLTTTYQKGADEAGGKGGVVVRQRSAGGPTKMVYNDEGLEGSGPHAISTLTLRNTPMSGIKDEIKDSDDLSDLCRRKSGSRSDLPQSVLDVSDAPRDLATRTTTVTVDAFGVVQKTHRSTPFTDTETTDGVHTVGHRLKTDGNGIRIVEKTASIYGRMTKNAKILLAEFKAESGDSSSAVVSTDLLESSGQMSIVSPPSPEHFNGQVTLGRRIRTAVLYAVGAALLTSIGGLGAYGIIKYKRSIKSQSVQIPSVTGLEGEGK